MKYLSVLLFLLYYLPGQSQISTLPTDRQYQWSKAGSVSYPAASLTLTLTDYLTGTDADAAISAALAELPETGGDIYIPAGTYVFTQPIDLPSHVHLRGAGSASTTLRFDLGGTQSCIRVRGSLIGGPPLSVDATRGSDYLIVPGHWLQAGDWLRTQMNDTDLVTSGWAAGMVGQINQVRTVAGDTLYLRHPLRLDLPLSREPVARPLLPVENAGVHCLRIERMDETSGGHTSLIDFKEAVSCTVEGVHGAYGNFAHVRIDGSAQISVRHSYFGFAQHYGGYGQGYGVVLQDAGSDCLIENNIFEHLRHSMLLQGGANGNVLAYNYSLDPYWEDVTTVPLDGAGDLVLHGNYVFANLLEGNVIQNIVVDDTHGANGPHNVFFRNRAERYGIFTAFGTPSNAQSFVGNEITSKAGFPYGLYLIMGTDHYEQANVVNEQIRPTGSAPLTTASLYRTTRPDYFDAELAYPSIGPPVTTDSLTIPAQYRYAHPTDWATCSPGSYYVPEEPVVVVNTEKPTESTTDWRAYPNPTAGDLYIEAAYLNVLPELTIIDARGRVVHRLKDVVSGQRISVAELPAGMYFLKAGQTTQRVLVLP